MTFLCVTKANRDLIIFLFSLVLSASFQVAAQNVGIGTTTPQARLHVLDSSVVFSGTGFVSLPAANPPITGPGKRMMWYADKAAFRTGYVQSDEWDNNNIGPYSFAAGFSTKAIGTTSFAFGNQTAALANYSTAMGIGSTAAREYSTAIGSYSKADGTASTVIGTALLAKALGAVVVGTNNDTLDAPDPLNPGLNDRIFQIGNGYATLSNAMTVLRNGNTGIGITTPQQRLSINNGMNIDQSNSNNGGLDNNVFRFGSSSGEAIGSARIGGSDNQFGLDFYTASAKRMVIANNGNVGIGITSPAATLEVMRGTGTEGTAAFQGTNYTSHFNYSTNEDTYIRAGKNGGNVILNDVTGGKVGIGTSTPGFPLNFPNTLGDKISMWGNTGSHYGFGIQNSLLQIHTDGSGSDIAFGSGSSGSFVEKFRMKGNGAFVVNGSAGSVGQVLTSNGNTSSPSWVNNPLNVLYNNMTEYTQSAPVVMAPQTIYQVPGMSNFSLVITSLSKVIFSASIEMQRDPCGGCGSSEEYLLIQMTSPLTTVAIATDYVFPSEKVTPTVGMKFLTLNPGTYTVYSYIFNGVGSNATARSGRLNIIIVPQ